MSWICEHQSFYWVKQLFCYCVHNGLMVLLWPKIAFGEWCQSSEPFGNNLSWFDCSRTLPPLFTHMAMCIHSDFFFFFFLFSGTHFPSFSQPTSFFFLAPGLTPEIFMSLAWNVGGRSCSKSQVFDCCFSFLFLTVCFPFALSFVFPGWISISWRVFCNSFFYSVDSSASYCCNILYR